MSRIELAGHGDPIPNIALPDPNLDSDFPPQVLVMKENGDFNKADWVALGYNHFEIWCIGGCGGYGGDVWSIDAGDPSYVHGMLRSRSYGGGGGGGGLQRIAGLLADLPASCPVIVGKAGADGLDGNSHWRWRVASAMQEFAGGMMNLAVIKGAVNIPGMVDMAGNPIPPYFYSSKSPYLFSPEPYYIAPLDGSDGGTSSFNGVLCQASGGKGGKKTPVYRDHGSDMDLVSITMETSPGGTGGDGGLGGRAAAGGSTGKGASSTGPTYPTSGNEIGTWTYTNPTDGGWDGAIGGGGGGGRGGTTWASNDPGRLSGARMSVAGPGELMHASGAPQDPGYVITRPSTPGARGAFSYGDTSVYGQKQANEGNKPGSGGGAKLSPVLRFGSYAAGSDPNGVVVIRVLKID